MPEVIISASGVQHGLIINPDGSLSISGTVNTSSSSNRTSMLSDVYIGTSGVTTNLSGNSVPNGYMVVIKSLATNVEYVGVGSRTSLFANSGLRLYPSDSVQIGVDNTNRISFVTRNNNDGVEVFSEI